MPAVASTNGRERRQTGARLTAFAAFATAAAAVSLRHEGSAWVGARGQGQPSQLWLNAEGAATGSGGVIAVLGANGRTGAYVVDALVKMGLKPRALTRSGRWTPPEGVEVSTKSSVEEGKADVTDPSSLVAGLAGASAVIFAAAYVRNKSLPKDIDYAGLVSTAKVVKEQAIGRLIVVSSAAVTRPYAPVGILLNTIGSGVLLEKAKGESEMRGILEGSSSTYTVVRPGGLKLGEPTGFQTLEFNQGDTLVGSVQRSDVAAVCAVAATDPQNRGANKTFEMYMSQGKSGLLPWYGDSKYVVSGRPDCGEMLAALKKDTEVTNVPGFLPF